MNKYLDNDVDLTININSVSGLKEGTVGEPSGYFTLHPTYGWFFDTDAVAISAAGVKRARFDTGGIDVFGTYTGTGDVVTSGNFQTTNNTTGSVMTGAGTEAVPSFVFPNGNTGVYYDTGVALTYNGNKRFKVNNNTTELYGQAKMELNGTTAPEYSFQGSNVETTSGLGHNTSGYTFLSYNGVEGINCNANGSTLYTAASTSAAPAIRPTTSSTSGIVVNTSSNILANSGTDSFSTTSSANVSNRRLNIEYQDGTVTNPQLALRRSDGNYNYRMYLDSANASHQQNLSGTSTHYLDTVNNGKVIVHPVDPLSTQCTFTVQKGDGTTGYTDLFKVSEATAQFNGQSTDAHQE